MSGYLTVANEVGGIADRNPEFAGAVYGLYLSADRNEWEPFDCRDRWLMRFGLSKRKVAELLAMLQDYGVLEIIDPGSPTTARMVRIDRPKVADRSPDRSPDRYPDRKRQTQTKPTPKAVEETQPVNGPLPGPLPGLQGVPRDTTYSTSTSDTSNLDIAAAVAAALDDGLDVEVVLKPPRKVPSGAYHGAIRAWDIEHAKAFGPVVYPWEFPHPDGARVKRWVRTAKIAEDNPKPGLERFQVACGVYFAAVKAGTAWPIGDPATTKHFTNDLAKWLRTDPAHVPRDGPWESPEALTAHWFGKGT